MGKIEIKRGRGRREQVQVTRIVYITIVCMSDLKYIVAWIGKGNAIVELIFLFFLKCYF